jgi:hypothetical protein
MTSAAQYRANRENARRSTGPKTEFGRLVSSQNAVKHGIWAEGLQPVARGAFCEDPEELRQFTEAMVTALGPRDALERQQAYVITGHYNRMRRLERYEALVVGGDGVCTNGEQRMEERISLHQMRAGWTQAIAETLEGDDDERFWNEASARIVLDLAGQRETSWVPPLWTEARTPRGADEWRTVVMKLVEQHFGPDPEQMCAWAWRTSQANDQQAKQLIAELAEGAARRCLEAATVSVP